MSSLLSAITSTASRKRRRRSINNVIMSLAIIMMIIFAVIIKVDGLRINRRTKQESEQQGHLSPISFSSPPVTSALTEEKSDLHIHTADTTNQNQVSKEHMNTNVDLNVNVNVDVDVDADIDMDADIESKTGIGLYGITKHRTFPKISIFSQEQFIQYQKQQEQEKQQKQQQQQQQHVTPSITTKSSDVSLLEHSAPSSSSESGSSSSHSIPISSSLVPRPASQTPPKEQSQHPQDDLISISLTRVSGSHSEIADVLLQLRMRQVQCRIRKTPASSFLEAKSRDVPLYQEVLREKHLATYYGTIRIGDSLFRVLFDTGSCELWVPSSECSTRRCRRHHRFPVEHNRFRYYKGEIMDIEYISGKVQGKLIVDAVTLGGLKVPNQIVGIAHTVDIELLDDVVWDGIVGLAYPSSDLVTKGVMPLFDNIIRQRVLSARNPPLANQFAYYIDDTQGVMTLGGVNCDFVVAASQSGSKDPAAIERCRRSFHFVPITEQTYWTVHFDDVSLSYPEGVPIPKGRTHGFCGVRGCRAIVDTGTYLIYTSNYFRIPPSWNTFAACTDISRLPNITFHFRTHNPHHRVSLVLEPREYVLKFDNGGRDECVVGISPDRDNLWTLGQVFLRAYYTLFDRDENRIGFTKVYRDGFAAINSRPSIAPGPKIG